MERLSLGVVALEPGGAHSLAAAAARNPDVVVTGLSLDDQPLAGLKGIVVDAPLAQRGAAIEQLVSRWRLPLLVKMPFAATISQAKQVRLALGNTPLFSLNPLQFHVPTKRLHDDIVNGDDPLETYFAVWRFKAGTDWESHIVQLIDHLSCIIATPVSRVSTMRRTSPDALVSLLRYENDVVGSIEIGAHLPASTIGDSDLRVECFCRESVFHCYSNQQAITVEGSRPVHRDWSPEASDLMVAAFVDALRKEQSPWRSIADDLSALALARRILTQTDEEHA
jgi:hypothetical protein